MSFKNELAILDLKHCVTYREGCIWSPTVVRELWIELYHVGWGTPYISECNDIHWKPDFCGVSYIILLDIWVLSL